MIPTALEAAEALVDRLNEIRDNPAGDAEFEAGLAVIAAFRERDRAILDEAERDCWNLAALRRRVLGE